MAQQKSLTRSTRPALSGMLSALIRGKTENGEELIDRLLDFARGTVTYPAHGEEGEPGYLPELTVRVEPKDSIRALETLVERAYGPARQEIAIENKRPEYEYDLTKLTDEELAIRAELDRKCLRRVNADIEG